MKMETKFTAGPWEFVPKLTASENHRGFFVRAEKATKNGKWALAEVQPGDEDGKLGEANARLIAAAPALLAALHEARRAIGDHFAPDDCYATGPLTGDAIRDLVQCPGCSAIAMYDAVIAKVTGDQP